MLSSLIEGAKHRAKELVFGAITSVVVALLVYLATGRNGDLVAWPSEQTPIYPSEQTKNLALPLLLSQTPVKSLTFINMTISNAGKAAIGGQEELWTLRIMGPPEATLMLVGEADRSSKRLIVLPSKSSAANVIAIQVGSLEPREFFDLRFIVVNASQRHNLHFELDTSLRGLPRPILADADAESRVSSRLFPWLWIALLFGFMYEMVRDIRRAQEKGSETFKTAKGWLRFTGRVVIGIFFSAAGAGLIGRGMGWTVVRLWRLGVLS